MIPYNFVHMPNKDFDLGFKQHYEHKEDFHYYIVNDMPYPLCYLISRKTLLADKYIRKICRYDSIKCLKYLNQLGVYCGNENTKGNDPVHIACIYNSIKCLKLLIADRKIKLDMLNNNLTPLDIAKRRNHSKCVKMLSDAGCK